MRMYCAFIGNDFGYGNTFEEAISGLLARICHSEKEDAWRGNKVNSALGSMQTHLKPTEFLAWAESMDMPFGLESKDLSE